VVHIIACTSVFTGFILDTLPAGGYWSGLWTGGDDLNKEKVWKWREYGTEISPAINWMPSK